VKIEVPILKSARLIVPTVATGKGRQNAPTALAPSVIRAEVTPEPEETPSGVKELELEVLAVAIEMEEVVLDPEPDPDPVGSERGCLGGNSMSSLLQIERSSPFLLVGSATILMSEPRVDLPEITFLV
jgi:hypothetical protein